MTRRASSARASRPARARARGRAVRGRPTFAGIACRCASSAHRRLEAVCSSSATRQGSSIRSPETACTRRSSPRGSPPTRSSRGARRSTSTRSSAALDRHAAASWKAKRAADRYPRACLWALRAPGVFGAVSGLLRGELAHPSEARRLARPAAARALPARRFALARLSAAQPCAWSKVEASRASTLPTTPFFTSCTTTVTFLSARPPVGVVVTM